nr:MAG TPA: pentapeptide repeat protein [Bacteriophage sp.]
MYCGRRRSGRDANRRLYMQRRLLQRELQQIIKGRNSGFWVAPKIYCSKTQKTLDGDKGWWYNKYHQVRRTHKNAEGEIKMEKMTQERIEEMCREHEKWLKNHREGECADFSHTDLRGKNLRGKNLRGASFEDADLTSAFMQGASFEDASFEGACLDSVRARGVNFVGIQADHADFTEAFLTGANFEFAQLQRANFEFARIGHVNFREADLAGSNFAHAYTGNTTFKRADISGVSWSNIGGANFDDKQIAEFAYQLCSAVLGGHTNSPEVKEEVRKILRLANSAKSVIVYGRVQEFNGVKHVTAKEAK